MDDEMRVAFAELGGLVRQGDGQTRSELTGLLEGKFSELSKQIDDLERLLLKTRAELMDRMDRLQDTQTATKARMDQFADDLTVTMKLSETDYRRMESRLGEVKSLRETVTNLLDRLRRVERRLFDD